MTHAVGGAAGALVFAPMVDVINTPAEYALVAVAGAGCALLNDLDTQGLAARTFGWPTRILAKGIHAISGGHRKGTHSILGIAIIAGLAWCAWRLFGPVGNQASAVLALGLGVRGLGFTKGGALSALGAFAACAGLVWVTARNGASYDWVPLVYGIGAFMHCAFDSGTQHGVPWLYPFIKTDFRFGAVNTGEWVENLLVLPGSVIATLAIAVWRLGWWPPIMHAATTAAASSFLYAFGR